MLAFVENNEIIKYPIDILDLQQKFPNTSFSVPLDRNQLSSYGVVEVEEIPAPQIDNLTEKITETTPVLVEGVWTQQWIVESLPETEQQQNIEGQKISVRLERNRLLEESDWTQNRDVVLSNDSDWLLYRQALRDITLQEGFPHNIIWPEIPQ